MLTRLLCVILFVATSCEFGLIPCAKVRPDKVRKTHISKRMLRYPERNTTASAREVIIEPAKSIRPDYARGSEVKPALENINVEEWDCPKPGGKRNLPKALKENIRKNKKAYESYYKNKADSLAALQPIKLK
jgi:hypothetical protein